MIGRLIGRSSPPQRKSLRQHYLSRNEPADESYKKTLVTFWKVVTDMPLHPSRPPADRTDEDWKWSGPGPLSPTCQGRPNLNLSKCPRARPRDKSRGRVRPAKSPRLRAGQAFLDASQGLYGSARGRSRWRPRMPWVAGWQPRLRRWPMQSVPRRAIVSGRAVRIVSTPPRRG